LNRASQEQDWTIKEGTEIVGSDGEKVGKVVAVEDNHLVVEKGFLFPSDYYIPSSAVRNFDGDKVYLNVTKDQALDQDWATPPVATTTTTDTTASDTWPEPVDRRRDDEMRTAAHGETINVPVMEEELSAVRHQVDRGSVRIAKDVVEEQQSIDVPVSEERVTMQRRTVDRAATAADMAFSEDSIEIPVRGEEVVVDKRARVTEEIEIGKENVERMERVTDSVRREEVRIDDSGNARSQRDEAGQNVSRRSEKQVR